jgi:hypothetical protein
VSIRVAYGRLHFGSTTIAGARYLRLVVTAPDTDEATLAELIGAIHEVPVAAGAGAGSSKRA